MELIFVAFFAGALTVLAPCILPLLPVIIGGSLLASSEKPSQRTWIHPIAITLSLAVSIVIFTLLLKATTALLGVPQEIWSFVSGLIVLLFGVHLLVPKYWESLMIKTGLVNRANAQLGGSIKQRGLRRDILIGASLGPIFSSCSPTYALIVATVLPASFFQGLIYLIAYALGLSLILLLIALFGTRLTSRLGVLSDPNGKFRKIIGVFFVAVGIMVIFGWDKDFQAFVLENGYYDPISRFEQHL